MSRAGWKAFGPDVTPVEVRADAAFTKTSFVAYDGTGDYTSDVDGFGYNYVDFMIDIGTLGSVTKITAVPQSGNKLDGSTTVYSYYTTEAVAAGVATVNVYKIELDDPTPHADNIYMVSLPVRGRYVRLQLFATHIDGGCSVYARRRV